MRLSIGIIYDELATYFSSVCLNGHDRHLNLQHCCFYDHELSLKSDTVYLFLSGTHIPQIQQLRLEPGTALIFSSEEDIFSMSQNASYLTINPERTSILQLSNRMNDLFKKYQNYENALDRAIFSDKTIQQMVSLANPIFTNELTLYDYECRIISRSFHEIMQFSRSGLPQPDHNGILPAEIMEALMRDSNYRPASQSDTPRYYHIEELGSSGLYYDIFNHDRFLLRIRLACINHPLRAYDSELLLHFAQRIREKIYADDVQSQNSTLYQLLHQLLTNPTADAERYLQQLHNILRWELGHTYVCVCLSLSAAHHNSRILAYYCALIHKLIPDVFSIQYANNIVLIANLSKHYRDTLSEFTNDLGKLIRDANMRAGFSLKFTSPLHLPYFYRQAKFALDAGTEINPEIWTHHFQQYVFSYLNHQLTEEFGSVAFCSQAIRSLQAYDEKKGSDLLHTLRVYLDNNQNATQTSKLLFINRGTLLHRLSKITDITNLQLDDTQALLLVHLFMTLMGQDHT